MSFSLKNVLFISHKYKISVVIQIYVSMDTNTQHRTELMQMAGRLEAQAVWSNTLQDSSYVKRATRLICIPFWLGAYHICLGTSHCISLSTSSRLPTSLWSLHFRTSISWLHKHLSKILVDRSRAERWAFHPIHHRLRQNVCADSMKSTATWQ